MPDGRVPFLGDDDCIDDGGKTAENEVFIKAIERYKRENRRALLTYREVLEVLRSLGYQKVAEATELPKPDDDRQRRKRTIPSAATDRRRSTSQLSEGDDTSG